MTAFCSHVVARTRYSLVFQLGQFSYAGLYAANESDDRTPRNRFAEGENKARRMMVVVCGSPP
jgi:hypothetical protein